MELEKNEENIKDYVFEKLKEVVVFLQYWWEEVIHWSDKVFPPDSRADTLSHWVHVATPFLITGLDRDRDRRLALSGLVILMLICCVKRCCCGGGRAVRMMKAPGRNIRMPRNVFERNPAGYFQNLRSGNSVGNLC
ncbi:hypothetical protein DCAR_0727388 [Daucus carota subsp. sativus]|uniref:Uncharacterized protein n=1 Tax=Daucus carota subsp. sativus TaxID=79200 RepID=A0AAF0XH41_DAUCS|nr:hypothetical protein DCAR_0727388 [Daucus carota subsp. sativus]